MSRTDLNQENYLFIWYAKLENIKTIRTAMGRVCGTATGVVNEDRDIDERQ